MKTLIRAITISLTMLLICGFIYPLGMAGISQLLFHKQANGSIVEYNGKPVGSELLGQAFTDTRFFHGRVSAYNYNTYKQEDTKQGVSSGSANLAPSNQALLERVQKEMDEFLKANPDMRKEDIPTDLLTSSASGLDPHISPEAAKIQIPAISAATGINISDLVKLVENCIEGRTLGILGRPRVNVLVLNIEIAQRLKL